MEKEMATHSSTLAWKIPWTEEPGRLQSTGSLESDTTEWLHFHFSLSCIGEGNDNLLQCSCLENPRDRGAWWLPSLGSHRVRHDWSNLAAVIQTIKNLPVIQETRVQSLGWEDPLKNGSFPFFTFTLHFHALEKEMSTHSSILAWKIPWTEEPGVVESMRLQSRTWLSN